MRVTRVERHSGVNRTADSVQGAKVIAGRYELLDLIGTGGSAEVFQARDMRLNRRVAVKLLKSHLAKDAEYLSRFEREATSSASLNHPNVVAIYDYGQDGDQTYLVIEYVTGGSLKERVQEHGRLPAQEAGWIATQILSALAAAHSLGLVHRDVKPQNVLFGVDGTAKLADFGIVQDTSGGQLTGEMMAIGSAAYIAPEQATGQRVGPGADVYGVGLLLYEMLTGHPPFVDGSGMQIAYRHVNETPVAPGVLNPEVPPALNSLVMRALEKNPTSRFPSAQSMIEGLKGIAAAPATFDAFSGDMTRPMPRIGVAARPQQASSGKKPVPVPLVVQSTANAGKGRGILFPMILGIVLGLGVLAAILGLGAVSSIWTLARGAGNPTPAGPTAVAPTQTPPRTPTQASQPTLTVAAPAVVIPPAASATPTQGMTPSPTISPTTTTSATTSPSQTSTGTPVPRTPTLTTTNTVVSTVAPPPTTTPVGILRPVVTATPIAPVKPVAPG